MNRRSLVGGGCSGGNDRSRDPSIQGIVRPVPQAAIAPMSRFSAVIATNGHRRPSSMVFNY